MKFLTKSALAVGMSAFFAIGSAQAASVSSLLYDFTLFEDDNAEHINVDQGNDNILDVGDSLRGILNITKLVNQDNPTQENLLGVGGNNELAGVFEVVVASKTFVNTDIFGNDLYNFTFTYSSAFATEFGLTDGAIIALFEDSTPEFAIGGTSCTTVGSGGDCEGNIIDGSFWASLGFAGDGDEFFGTFTSPAPEDVTAAAGFGNQTSIGNFLVQASLLDNNTGREWNQVDADLALDDGFIDFAGSSSILGVRGVNTPYQITTDTDYVGKPVPAPATLALLGLGLIGMAGVRRRKA